MSAPKVFQILDPGEVISDARGHVVAPVPKGTPVYFIDLFPDANWGHACIYLVGGTICMHEWPPARTITLIEQG
jgi:hypothetical protein